jgi:hypothetical protein
MWLIALVLAANPHLDEARKLYEQLKYPDAVARLRVARTAPNNSPEENQQIADLLARALIAQGKTADAEKAWAELLAEQPDAPDPSDASPKIREVFLRAKRGVYPPDFVKLERGPSPPEMFEATLTDPWRQVEELTWRCNDGEEKLPVAKRFSMRLREGDSCQMIAISRGKEIAHSDPVAYTSRAAVPSAAVPGVAEEPVPQGPRRWPGILTGVLALAAAGVAAGFGVSSWLDYSKVNPTTGAMATTTLDASARTKAGVAYGAGAGALALTALMIVFLMRF